jgi:hypothetical protein
VRQNDNYWQTVSLVQITPGYKLGIGPSICFTFCAHTDNLTNKYSGKIRYNYQQFLRDGMTEDELMHKWPSLYCIMQCHKIGYFVKLVHNIEIVRMNVEF